MSDKGNYKRIVPMRHAGCAYRPPGISWILATRNGNNNRKGASPRNLISPFVEITKLASRFESEMMMDEVEAKSKPMDDAEVDAKSKPMVDTKSKPMDDAESSPKCE